MESQLVFLINKIDFLCQLPSELHNFQVVCSLWIKN